MIALRFALCVLPILLWGDAALALSSTPRGRAFRVGASYLLGSGVTTLAVFGLLSAGVGLDPAVLAVAVLAFPAWLVTRRIRPAKGAERPSPRDASTSRALQGVFAAVLMVELGTTAWAAAVSPLIAWDAWVNFASKARILASEQRIVPAIHADPGRLATNLDYPLMLPIQEAWSFTFLGQPDDRSAGGLAFLYFAALLSVFHGAARRVAGEPAALGFTALLASVPRLSRGAPAAMADVPLSALVLLAFVFLAEELDAIRERQDARRWPGAALLGLASGLLPWMKNEGWIWLALVLGVLVVVAGRRGGAAIAVTCMASISIALVWQVFLATNGTIRYVFDGPTALFANLDRVVPVTRAIVRRLASPYWSFVWPLAAVTLAVRRSRALNARDGWLVTPAAVYILVSAGSYLLSRFDPYLAHLVNSSERLMLHALPLAVWWLAAQAADAGWVRRREV